VLHASMPSVDQPFLIFLVVVLAWRNYITGNTCR
jgi:hypothetical protein